jgi:hypothetical protein
MLGISNSIERNRGILTSWSSHDYEFSLILVIVTVKIHVWKTPKRDLLSVLSGAN